MSDDPTLPPTSSKWAKARAAYKSAEESFDIFAAALLRSPLTLGAFVLWTVALVVLGRCTA